MGEEKADGEDRPSMFALWRRAQVEGGTKETRRARYLALLREHGHLVQRNPGESTALPCGWDPKEQRDV